MKLKILLAVASLVVLTGCSSKSSKLGSYLENGSDKYKTNKEFAGESVNIGEECFDISQHNSSKDNFKSIYFGFNDYSVSGEMMNNMDQNINVATSTQDYIVLEGNCDEFGTDEYNYALGLKRAKSVKDALVSSGVESDRINVVSLGESTPVCTKQTDNCYKLNRRVDLQLSK